MTEIVSSSMMLGALLGIQELALSAKQTDNWLENLKTVDIVGKLLLAQWKSSQCNVFHEKVILDEFCPNVKFNTCNVAFQFYSFSWPVWFCSNLWDVFFVLCLSSGPQRNSLVNCFLFQLNPTFPCLSLFSLRRLLKAAIIVIRDKSSPS